MKHTALATLTALLLVPLGTLPAANAPAQPNLIIILADDLGYGDVGCFGSREIRTPNLDRMAAEGMRFTSFYAQSFCGPSRAALMTGCYPLRLAEVGNQKHHMTVPHARETLLSEVLKGAGYTTAQIGKWDLAGHLPDHFEHPGNAPLQRGFDFHFGTPASNDQWTNTVMYRNGAIIENPVDLAESTTKRYADEAIRFIRERKARPFFIYLCPNMPHTALHAGAEFRGKSPRGLYGDVVEELDHHIGRILATLRSEGVEQNTLVLFTSDNGPWLLRKQDGGSAGPLRGGKTSTWEGGVRVPAIAWAPGRITPGQTCNRIASTLDLLPTLTKLAGAKLPENKLDGRDLSAWLLQGPPADEDKAVHLYHVETHLQAVRQGRWKLHLARPYPVPWLHRGLRRAHVADADRFEIKTPLLYDVEADIGEKNDVAALHPEVVQSLLTLAQKARDEIGDYDRIGSRARFFDEGPQRPDMDAWKADQNQAPASKAKKGAAKSSSKAAPSSSSASGAKPNIVLILADDLGYADLGCQGSAEVKSPQIDSIAANGLRCTAGYGTAPQCCPSRAGLMTGRYQNRFGFEANWGTASGREGLPLSEATMADRFKAAGYVTGMIGKWHLGDSEPMRPYNRGFVKTLWHPNGGVLFPEKKTGFLRNLHRDAKPVQVAEYSTDAFGREATEFIGRHRHEPFFLYLAFVPPHWPMEAKPEHLARFAHVQDLHRRTFLAMMASLDENVGRVLAKLRETGLEENTLVFFLSDNGGPTGFKPRTKPDAPFEYGQNTSRNDPCRGVKGDLLEGGIRIPFLVQWKGHIPAGKVYDQPVISLDILPTALAAAGVNVPPQWKLDGTNLLPFLTGANQGAPHDTLYWRFRFPPGQPPRHRWAIRQGDWKLVKNDVAPLALYNLTADIGEKQNLAAVQPERARAMAAAWKQWNAELKEPLWIDTPQRKAPGKQPPATAPGVRATNDTTALPTPTEMKPRTIELIADATFEHGFRTKEAGTKSQVVSWNRTATPVWEICHRHSGRGNVVGPDLSAVAARGNHAWLLESLLQPSREIAPEYLPRMVVLKNGTEATGIRLRSWVMEQLRDANGLTLSYKLEDIESIRDLTTSFMPEGLVYSLTDRELRDLIAFLESPATNEASR